MTTRCVNDDYAAQMADEHRKRVFTELGRIRSDLAAIRADIAEVKSAASSKGHFWIIVMLVAICIKTGAC